MILLKPNGGLCNRIRTIDSGIMLSQQIKKPLRVLWTLGPELNCSFNLLFEADPRFEVTEARAMPLSDSRLLNTLIFVRDYWHYRRRCRRVIFQTRMNSLIRQNFNFTELAKYDSIFISCCNRFYRPQRKLQPLRPTAELRARAEAYIGQFTNPTLGIHIRRTDHNTVSSFSPEQGFLDAMNAQIRDNPETRFFLATDSPEIMSRFRALYQDRILWHPKDYSRNSSQGIQDALIDLLCLSRTTKIIGSRMSSFSETAAQINDIPLDTIEGT